MERLQGGAVPGEGGEAQELVYDAWEAEDSDDAYDLLSRAVEMDPTNVDAWLGLMELEPLDDDARIKSLRHVVELGEKQLGPKTFDEDKGFFWGLLETRPYMRARAQLAQCLMNMKRFDEAIVEQEALLELNPNDNQGVRYGLVTCYLTTDRLDDARRLLEQYDEQGFSTVWSWALVLERFLSGEIEGAQDALRDARKQNPHAQAYFLEHRKLPKTMPGSYGIGTREEAVTAWDILQPAWQGHPEAQAWLSEQKREGVKRSRRC